MSLHLHRNFQRGKMLCLKMLGKTPNKKMVPIFSTSRFQSFFNEFQSKASLPRSVQKVIGHLNAFRFSIVFNWYVYDQEEDKP